MDRLIESLSHVVSKGGGYSSSNYLSSLNENNGHCTFSTQPRYCFNLRGEYDRFGHSEYDNIPRSDIYGSDFESVYPYSIHDSYPGNDNVEASARNASRMKSLGEFQETIGSNSLRSFISSGSNPHIIDRLSHNKSAHSVFNHLAQPVQLDERKTASNIAMKYSPEDIILSKVRGIFMNRYSRDSISQDQINALLTETQKKSSAGPMERLINNFDMEAAYKDMEAAFSEAIDDCYARFFTNLPVNLLEDAIHLYFQIQAAYWWYEDMWYDKYSHVLPKLSLRVFGQFVVEDCPILRHFVSSPEEHDKFLLNWKRYCKTIPLRGVILINKEFTKCVLVKPWNGNRFMFPRGKMDEMEEDSLCAIREAYEELGIDVTKHLNDSIYIEKQVDEQTIKLFLIPGIDENTPLEPKKRKEISEIRWFNLTSLPNWNISNSTKQRKSKHSDSLILTNGNLSCISSEHTSVVDRQDANNSENDDFMGNNEKIQGSLQSISEKPDSSQFFRVSHFTRNLRGWIEVLKKIPLYNPNIPDGIIPNLPKNLNPAVIRRLQNADLGGPPLSSLPLFVRVKCNINEGRSHPTSTSQILSQGNKKKSRPHVSEATRDRRTFGTKAGSGWDVEAMFALNEQKFGVKSTFSLDEYTIPLPKIRQKK
ncbi:ataxin2 related nudix domain-containing protein (RNA processing phosphatase/ATPase domain) [Cryptosporidium canis]|uniref:Ataxin2 related nudix domain-containing protein (RNA processing phosphatase/ATPase domain) n=1 Tax=Cryptosporidium canis TaxID=195482 RepID=A0A9D5HYA4_9CRYT|nr:ataxin2 related nudix domain-containing protein (RNA processing phosphatase/ATPase domain) [Cryptosporidium canis]